MADIVQLVENGQKKYLKTHVNAVEGLTKELEGIANGVLATGKVIFDGSQYFNANHVHAYSQSDLKSGIALIFERFDPSTGQRLGYGQTLAFFPKAVLETIYSISQNVPLVNASKAFTIYMDKIEGHDTNSTEPSKNMCLRRIIIL